MFPTYEQIQHEAYLRWERRGWGHGCHDEDWLAAEQDLLLTLNYEIVIFYPLRPGAQEFLGARDRRVCRFCEQSAPAARFSGARPALPAVFGNALVLYEICDECHEQFKEDIDAGFERFLVRAGSAGPGAPHSPRMSIAALKGLAKVALSIMPAEELESFEDTIEWVANPDHDLDISLFNEPTCDVHVARGSLPYPWVALARRVDDEAPMPYMLVYAATGELVVHGPVLLCARDHDLDGERTVIPRACPRVDERTGPTRGASTALHPRRNGVGRGAGTLA